MLKKRILTAIFLIPIFVALLLLLPPLSFALLTMVFVLLGAWEWSNLAGFTKKSYRFMYVLLVFLLLHMIVRIYVPTLLLVTFIWWMIACLLVASYPRLTSLWGRSVAIKSLMGLFVLLPTWVAINFIRNNQNGGPLILLMLFVLIWTADSSAYFAGKQWGDRKLLPNVSPGKTRVGFVAALLSSVLVGLVLVCIDDEPAKYGLLTILLCVVTCFFSIVGDLLESMLKRNRQIKDSGTLFPGHGGLLDRIDSLTAAAPIFAWGSFIIGRIFH